jgi:hypothetical protein
MTRDKAIEVFTNWLLDVYLPAENFDDKFKLSEEVTLARDILGRQECYRIYEELLRVKYQ